MTAFSAPLPLGLLKSVKDSVKNPRAQFLLIQPTKVFGTPATRQALEEIHYRAVETPSPDLKEPFGREGQRNAVVIRGGIKRCDGEQGGREEKAAEFSRDPQSSGRRREEKGEE